MTFEKNIFDLSNIRSLFILEDKESFNSQSLINKIHSLKNHLEQNKIGPGHKVVLCLPNSKLFCEYFFAIWEIGACVVPISPLSTEIEIVQIVANIKPSLVIKANGKEEFLSNSSLTNKENVLILHTSGSSGKPKGVMLSRQALMAKMEVYRSHLPLSSFSKTLCMLPLNFGHGLISNFLFPLLSGNEVVLAPSSRLEIYSSLGEIVDEFGITCFSSVPSILKIASNFSKAPEKKTLTKIFCASAPLDKETWSNTMNWSSGVRVDNMYGMTELASWIAGDQKLNQAFEENTFDNPWGAEVRIVKEDPIDDYGEIQVRSESMMIGYYNDLENTKKVLTDGWFKTGDMGLMSADRITLKGRRDNVINLSGIKVYPEEINQILRKHPAVQDVFTIGLKVKEGDADHGIGCVLVPRLDQEIKIQEIQEMCKEHLSSYKIPAQFKIVEKLPTNERGKSDLASIKKLFQVKARVN